MLIVNDWYSLLVGHAGICLAWDSKYRSWKSEHLLNSRSSAFWEEALPKLASLLVLLWFAEGRGGRLPPEHWISCQVPGTRGPLWILFSLTSWPLFFFFFFFQNKPKLHAPSLFPLGLSLAVTVPTLALHLAGKKASGEAVVDPNQTGKREWSAMWFHGARSPTKPGGAVLQARTDLFHLDSLFFFLHHRHQWLQLQGLSPKLPG